MKRIVAVLFIVGAMAAAFASISPAQVGPNVAAFADATATACAAATPVANNQTQIIAAGTTSSNLAGQVLCFSLNNVGATNPARCGDSVSALQGQVLNPTTVTNGGGGNWNACVTSAINCCGVGGSTVIGGVKYTR
jgi:hypothetical protein